MYTYLSTSLLQYIFVFNMISIFWLLLVLMFSFTASVASKNNTYLLNVMC